MHRILILAAVCSFALASSALAEESCSGSGKPLPKSRIEKNLAAKGYVKIRGIDLHNGCYEAKGFDKSGKRFELEINSHTGKIVTRE